MPRFVKKPVEIEAVQFLPENHDDILALLDGYPWWMDEDGICFKTIDGNVATVKPGWWLVKGVQGEYYPCQPDIFDATYWVSDEFCPDPARDLIYDGIEALRLTREYVGEELLPDAPGWSWADWIHKAEDFLYD